MTDGMFDLNEFTMLVTPKSKKEALPTQEYDNDEFTMQPVEKVVVPVDGFDGMDGSDGSDGSDGRDGVDAKAAIDGSDGSDGTDGSDGVSVVDGFVDSRDHLMMRLSDGKLVDAGYVRGPQGFQGPQGNGGGKGYRGGGYKPPPNLSKGFFGSFDLSIGINSIVHGLDLRDKDAFIINTMQAGAKVSFAVGSIDVNTITITTPVAIAAVKVTVIGV